MINHNKTSIPAVPLPGDKRQVGSDGCAGGQGSRYSDGGVALSGEGDGGGV